MINIQLSTEKMTLLEDDKKMVYQKFSKLDKFFKKKPTDLIKLKVAIKRRAHRTEDDIYVVRLCLYLPKKIISAHQDGYSLEEALNEAIHDLKIQLVKHRTRNKSSL